MRYVNVIFGMKTANVETLKDNFRFNPDGSRVRTDLTVSQAKKLLHHYDGPWPSFTHNATDWSVLTFTFPEELQNPNDITAGHKWIEFLLNKWPGVWIVVGCWKRNGLQWGTNFGEDGVTIIDTPVYPVHPQHMLIMPDDVTYDDVGNEVSRTPATVPVDVNLVCGWAPRRWS